MDFHNQHKVHFDSVHEIVAHIQDGDTIAIGGFWFVRIPVALVDALVKKGVRNLTVITQASGLALEQLIAAKLVKKVIFSFASLDIFGLPPYFRKAVEKKEIEWEEWTALRMNQALEAGRQNLPSFVMQPPYGSEFMEETDDFHVVTCPLTGSKLGVMKSIQPDVALIHAQKADEKGNVQIQGSLGIDRLYIGASKKTFVSVEEIVPVGGFEPDPRSCIIPHFLINRICQIPGGAYPTSCMPYYITDYWHLSAALKDALQTGGYGSLRQPAGHSLTERIEILNEFVQTNASDFEEKLRKSDRLMVSEAVAGGSDEPYTVDELMACLLAEQVADHMVCTVGSNTPLSMVAYLLAKKTHAPNVVLIPFTGLNDIPVYPITLSLAEVFAFKQSTSHWAIEDLWQWIYQKSLTALEFGSTAQIDVHGRINNSIIGTTDRIKVRLPGQAGLADVANLHHNFHIYITRHEKRRLVEQVDFISGARYFRSSEERAEAGLPPGLSKVFTNLCIFELDPVTGKLVLTHLHPGVSLEEVREQTSFPIVVSDHLQVTKAPNQEQLHLIRNVIDPLGFRKLEFHSTDRDKLIRDMLDQEQLILFGQKRLTFTSE